jgi:hypothetical protein
MKKNGEGFDFESAIGGDGKIAVPESVLHSLGAQAGARVRVRLMPAVIAATLERKHVTAEEVERIATVQLESQAQVISFLLAEGVLAPGGGKRLRTKGRAR